jgi:hypothetical protein
MIQKVPPCIKDFEEMVHSHQLKAFDTDERNVGSVLNPAYMWNLQQIPQPNVGSDPDPACIRDL